MVCSCKHVFAGSNTEDLHSEQQVQEKVVMAEMKSLMIQGKATIRQGLSFYLILNEVMMAAMRQKRNYRLPRYNDRC
jgi:hypothetical protein